MGFIGSEDRCAIVTGASSGIGLEIARGLAAQGSQLLLPVRDRDRGEAAIRSIRDTVPAAKLQLADLDLASLDSVSSFVGMLREAGRPIELLVLNAGIVNLGVREPQFTADGFELTFQTNYLGHFALTLSLLPLLSAGSARIVVQCSIAAAQGRFSFEGAQASSRYRPFRAYRQSKIALGMFGLELARRSESREWGVTVQLCHPGVSPGSKIAPGIRKKVPKALLRSAIRLGNPPAAAAQTAVAAAVAETSVPSMFVPSGWFGIAGPPRARDPFLSFSDTQGADELWRCTETLLATVAERRGSDGSPS